MKRKIPLVFLGLLLSLMSFSQEASSEKISIKVEDYKALIENQAFQSLMQTYNIVSIERFNPNVEKLNHSLTAELVKYYTLDCDCNVSELAVAIKENISKELVSICEVVSPPELMFSPSDYLQLKNNWDLKTWAVDSIFAPQAWDVTKGSSRVTIAISDSEFDPTHPDLVNKIDFIHPNAYITPPTSSDGHGTSSAGIAAAQPNNGIGIAGVGYNSRLALFQKGHNYFDDIYFSGAQIINCSWAGGYSLGNQQIIDAITDMGMIVVAAAGNGFQTASNCLANNGDNNHNYRYPASYNNVISVSGISKKNTFTECKHCRDHYVNSGHTFCYTGYDGTAGMPPHTHNDKVDVLAPGFCVMALTNSQYSNGLNVGKSGTSQAAPLISGVVALMLDVNPCLDQADVESILKSTGTDVSGYHDNQSYYPGGVPNRVNAHAAVLEAQNFVISDIVVTGTHTVNGDRYRNQNYIVKNGGKLVFASGSNSYFCRGGGVNVLVEDGGTMTVENNATVNVSNYGMIVVEHGGQLILKNNVAGKGLVIGQIANHTAAGLVIEGNVLVDNGANFTINGHGHVAVKQGGSMAFKPGATMDWDMYGTGKLVMEQYSNLNIHPENIDIRNGSILYGKYTSITLNSEEVSLTDITASVLSFGYIVPDALRINATTTTVENCEFGHFADGVTVVTPSQGASVSFSSCDFHDMSKTALEVNNASTSILHACTFTDNITGISLNGNQAGTSIVNISETNIIDCISGILANNLEKLELEYSTSVSGSEVGVSGLATDLFLRHESEITACETGIDMEGVTNGVNTITIGDDGCGHVYDNVLGINGVNMLLDADAVGNNPPVCATCAFVTNKFHGNDKIGHLCYTNIALQHILVSGAFFGGTNPNSSTTGLYAGYTSSCPGQFSYVTPIVVENECDNYYFGCLCQDGGSGGNPDSESSEEEPNSSGMEGESLKMGVFPNPTRTGKFNLDLVGFKQNKSVQIIDSRGIKVAEYSFVTNQYSVDLSKYAKGMYLITVSDGFSKKSQSVVFQ